MTAGKRLLAWWKPILTVFVAAAVLFSGSSFWIYNATIVAIYAIAIVGLNILVGLAGQVSFAQTGFMAVGGYVLAIFTVSFHWDPWLALLLAVAGAGIVAALFGWPLLRLRGHYLTMATFALGMGVYALATGANFMGGAVGISAIPPLAIGPVSFASPVPAFLLAFGLFALSTALFSVLRNSPVGRGWRALSVREDAAASIGVPSLRYKIAAFALSAMLGAVSGALYVNFTTYVGPDLYSSTIIVNPFLMLFIGGLESPYGSLVGAAVVLVIPELISGLANIEGLIFDMVLLAVIILRPENRTLGRRIVSSIRQPSPVIGSGGSAEAAGESAGNERGRG